MNNKDSLFLAEKNPNARDTLLVDFKPLKDSKTGEIHANIDIVLGLTPNEENR